ncbi:hypothetical protein G6514_003945, partial [Epicoccum nigrum]
IGVQDGDILDVFASWSDSSSDKDKQWLAQLAATELKIVQLQHDIESRRAELKAAAVQNEAVASRVLSIQIGLHRLRRQKRRIRRYTGEARSYD